MPKIDIEKIKPPQLRVKFRLLLYLASLIFGALSIMETILGYFYPVVDIIIYVIAACGIFLSCYYLICNFNYGIRLKVRPVIESNDFTNRVYKDYRFRTVLSAFFSFLINLFYAVSNGIIGILNHSAWFGTLAAYYIFLSVMRFTTVWYERKISKLNEDKKRKIQELTVYRHCGILLILITIALGGAVLLLLDQKGGKSYPGTLIFAVAAYTFYKIILSVINMVKTKRMKSPLLATIRNIGYADALVSILSLQTAMLVSFKEGGELDPQMMNGLTGVGVCMMILFIGIYMTYTSIRKKRILMQENNGEL
ncbi:MAG: hypothetical protein QM683_08485 [Lacrimispora sp.]